MTVVGSADIQTQGLLCYAAPSKTSKTYLWHKLTALGLFWSKFGQMQLPPVFSLEANVSVARSEMSVHVSLPQILFRGIIFGPRLLFLNHDARK